LLQSQAEIEKQYGEYRIVKSGIKENPERNE
jgi:hypothetical protein